MYQKPIWKRKGLFGLPFNATVFVVGTQGWHLYVETEAEIMKEQGLLDAPLLSKPCSSCFPKPARATHSERGLSLSKRYLREELPGLSVGGIFLTAVFSSQISQAHDK